MASNHPDFNRYTPSRISQSSNHHYFTGQAVRAGYIKPESGQYQHFEGQPCPQNAGPHSHAMHRVIQRELEKEHLRQEIIMSEILRMRAQLIAERAREMPLQNGFQLGPFMGPGFDSQMGTFSRLRVEERSLVDERNVLTFMERERFYGRPY